MSPRPQAHGAAPGPPPDPERVAEIAAETMRVEQSRGEAVRTRATGLLGSCGVLLALTVGLGDSAAKAASGSGRVGEPLAVSMGLAAVLLLLASAVLAALVFAPMKRVARAPMQALRAFVELELRTADSEALADAGRERLHEARVANVVRGRRLLESILCFVAALGCLAVEAAIVGLHRL